MDEAVVALVAALGSSVLTAGASLGVVRYQQRLRDHRDDEGALGRALVEVLARSLGAALRIRMLAEAAKHRSGVGEGLDVTFGLRKPADLLEFYDWLDQDWGPLNAAWSEVWARGDQQLVTTANGVLAATEELMSVALAQSEPDGLLAKARQVVVGVRWSPEHLVQINDALVVLANARRDLTAVARDKLGRGAIDPFAQG
jgi:hypothetical protein